MTSFTKSYSKSNLNSQVEKNLIAYRKYTDWFEYPSALKGPSYILSIYSRVWTLKFLHFKCKDFNVKELQKR